MMGNHATCWMKRKRWIRRQGAALIRVSALAWLPGSSDAARSFRQVRSGPQKGRRAQRSVDAGWLGAQGGGRSEKKSVGAPTGNQEGKHRANHASVGCTVIAEFKARRLGCGQEPPGTVDQSRARHCAKGASVARTRGHGGPAAENNPMKLVNGEWQKISWGRRHQRDRGIRKMLEIRAKFRRPIPSIARVPRNSQ